MPTTEDLTALTRTLNDVNVGLTIPLEGLFRTLIEFASVIRQTTDPEALKITDMATAKLYAAAVSDCLYLREQINKAIGWPV